MTEIEIGVVRKYFHKISVAAIEITDGGLAVGDTVHIHGHTTDFTATVNSMQVEHASVETAAPGDAVGMVVCAQRRFRRLTEHIPHRIKSPANWADPHSGPIPPAIVWPQGIKPYPEPRRKAPPIPTAGITIAILVDHGPIVPAGQDRVRHSHGEHRVIGEIHPWPK